MYSLLKNNSNLLISNSHTFLHGNIKVARISDVGVPKIAKWEAEDRNHDKRDYDQLNREFEAFYRVFDRGQTWLEIMEGLEEIQGILLIRSVSLPEISLFEFPRELNSNFPLDFETIPLFLKTEANRSRREEKTPAGVFERIGLDWYRFWIHWIPRISSFTLTNPANLGTTPTKTHKMCKLSKANPKLVPFGIAGSLWYLLSQKHS